MRLYEVALVAGQPLTVHQSGAIFVLDAAVPPLLIEFFDARGIKCDEELVDATPGSWARPINGYSSLRFTSAASQSAKYYSGRGEVRVGGLTDKQLRASPVPVVIVGAPIIILCPSNNSIMSLVGSVVYYFGGQFPVGNLAALNRIYFRDNCRIKQLRHTVYVSGVVGTAEQATTRIRVNDVTDFLVSAIVQFNVVGPTRFDNNALDIPIAAGDFVEVTVTTPAFVTAPTGVLNGFEIIAVSD